MIHRLLTRWRHRRSLRRWSAQALPEHVRAVKLDLRLLAVGMAKANELRRLG